jgi:hypothetical protein
MLDFDPNQYFVSIPYDHTICLWVISIFKRSLLGSQTNHVVSSLVETSDCRELA